MKPRPAHASRPDHLFTPKPVKPTSSWWIAGSREDFTAKAQAEAERLRRTVLPRAMDAITRGTWS